jgi:hypothetical protein
VQTLSTEIGSSGGPRDSGHVRVRRREILRTRRAWGEQDGDGPEPLCSTDSAL